MTHVTDPSVPPTPRRRPEEIVGETFQVDPDTGFILEAEARRLESTYGVIVARDVDVLRCPERLVIAQARAEDLTFTTGA